MSRTLNFVKAQTSPSHSRIPLSNITNLQQHSKSSQQSSSNNSLNHHNSLHHYSNILQQHFIVPQQQSIKLAKRSIFMNTGDQSNEKYPLRKRSRPQTSKQYRCTNHGDRESNHKLDTPIGSYYYCPQCAGQLEDAGHSLSLIRDTNPMVDEASRYLQVCEQSLVSLEIQQRELEIGELSIVRHFERLVEEAENDKKAEIDEICRKYLQKTDRISAEKKLIEAKHYEERNKAVCFKKQLEEVKTDIMRNMTHIEQDFDTAEFRAVMSVYWAKIAAFQHYKQQVHTLLQKNAEWVPQPAKSPRGGKQSGKSQESADRQFTFSKKNISKTLRGESEDKEERNWQQGFRTKCYFR